MKKIVIVFLVAAAGYLAYSQFLAKPLSPDERELRRMEKAFSEQMSRYGQANRAMGVSGLDTTSDIEDVIGAVKRLEKELEDFVSRMDGGPLLDKAENLRERVKKFLDDKR